MPTVETLLTTAQVAKLLGLSPRTVHRMMNRGKMPGPVHVGRAVRFRTSAIDRWIKMGCPDRRAFRAGESKGEHHE